MTLTLLVESDTSSDLPLNMRPIQNKGERSHTIEFAALIAEVSDHDYLLRVAAPR